MSQLLYFPKTRRDRLRDDLGIARGLVIAVILGAAVWATMFMFGQWLLD
jgi:hypothetical protein